MKQVKVIGIVLVAAAAAFALVACSGGSSSSSSASVSSSASSASSASSSSVETDGGEDIVTIALDYNAGTGYEWQCSIDPEGVVSEVDKVTKSQTSDKEISGGPLQDLYTFRAAKPGEVTLTFNLVRSWEGEPAETQVYAFTVSDDLKMTLNPYKSNFQNEPEWGSNS